MVDVYTVNGKLLHHLVSNGLASPLNEPWGMAIAPTDSGRSAATCSSGTWGTAAINAFNPTTGKFLGTLRGAHGSPIAINGLWGLRAGQFRIRRIIVAGVQRGT